MVVEGQEMKVMIKYKFGRMSPWRTLINEQRKPMLYANKKRARQAAMHYRRRNPDKPFFFRIKEVF